MSILTVSFFNIINLLRGKGNPEIKLFEIAMPFFIQILLLLFLLLPFCLKISFQIWQLSGSSKLTNIIADIYEFLAHTSHCSGDDWYLFLAFETLKFLKPHNSEGCCLVC